MALLVVREPSHDVNSWRGIHVNDLQQESQPNMKAQGGVEQETELKRQRQFLRQSQGPKCSFSPQEKSVKTVP